MTSRALASASRVPTRIDDPVAMRVRERRLQMGWSLKRLSEATGGLAPSFLFNIECGRKVPGEDVAVRLAHALEDGAFEDTYRAWARAKSRGRSARTDHDVMLRAWEQLRNPFAAPATPATADTATPASSAREGGRLRVPVLADASDPGDGVRPPAELVVNALALDPQIYGNDHEQARARFARLRRPFAFPLDEEQAARAGLPVRTLAVVTREAPGEADPTAAYVVRCRGRLEVVPGSALAGGPVPESLRARGLTDAAALRASLVGRVDLSLPDVRR
jgi:transcriptional regulator with XRE-family HTH domain